MLSSGTRSSVPKVPVEDASRCSTQQSRDVVRDVPSAESRYGSSESDCVLEVVDREWWCQSRA